MKTHYCIAIIGAGFAGLGLSIRLLQEGEDDFVILEKSDRVGGTWRDNTYPGAACDVQSHLYWFSFVEQPDWSRIYPGQAEILTNIERMVDRHGVRPHLRFSTELDLAHWDDEKFVWVLHTKDGSVLTADYLISGWGQLNRPSLHGIPGVESFKGAWFHSARWDHDVPLEGKRIASIGNGPSAAQFIPEIAKIAGHLTVFQRSATHIVPRGDAPYSPEERREFMADPIKREASRRAYYLDHETWYGAMRQGTEKAAEFTAVARDMLQAQVGDPDLRAKLWPNYPVGCKRIIISDDYLSTFTQQNVTLATDRIAQIEATGVRTEDGALHEFDVIIYGTGFDTLEFVAVADVIGRNEQSLRQAWRDAPRAHLGVTVPGFPNFFMLYGPNTNLGHNSILLMLECQFNYILQAISEVERHQAASVELLPEVLQASYKALQERLAGSSWAGGCQSWYKTKDNLITNNWSGSVEDYKAATAKFDPAEYRFVSPAQVHRVAAAEHAND